MSQYLVKLQLHNLQFMILKNGYTKTSSFIRDSTSLKHELSRDCHFDFITFLLHIILTVVVERQK